MATQKTEEKVEEKTAQLVKGVSLEIQEKATKLVADGHAAKAEEDDIRAAIFGLGINFGKVNQIYNVIMKELGLAIDVKAVKKQIGDLIDRSELTCEETWAQLKELSDAICAEVKGATQPRVFAMLKQKFASKDFEMPRKPATARGRMGAINKVLVNAFKEDPKISAADLEAKLAAVTKTPANAASYVKAYHTMLFAVANGLSANEALTQVAKVKEEAKAEVEPETATA